MSENEQENVHENVQDNYESDSGGEQPEPLLKRITPQFKAGRPRKTDEEKAQTRRAMLDRRNERNKARVQVDKVTKKGDLPMIADFSHTKNNRVDGVINPNLDPLFNDKLEFEKRLLQKKYMIEDKKLDMYLQQMGHQVDGDNIMVKPKKKRAPPKPKVPKQLPPIVPSGPREKTPQEKADDIFKMYN